MGNMIQFGKLLCTYCLNSLIDFVFCMIICIPLLWMYYLTMESVNWPKYLTTKFIHVSHFSGKCARQFVIFQIQFPFEVRKSQDLQVVRYFGQLTLSIFKWYIHNKCIQIIIQNTKSIKELRQCVHNNLLSWFMFPIQLRVCLLVRYLTDTAALWNEKVTRLASGEIFWSVNTLHLQIIYS